MSDKLIRGLYNFYTRVDIFNNAGSFILCFKGKEKILKMIKSKKVIILLT